MHEVGNFPTLNTNTDNYNNETNYTTTDNNNTNTTINFNVTINGNADEGVVQSFEELIENYFSERLRRSYA